MRDYLGLDCSTVDATPPSAPLCASCIFIQAQTISFPLALSNTAKPLPHACVYFPQEE
ncbi:hypothetical protein [Staphylococcus coagulans]|uniref:hypothetical protein n=1 Tax=Staphylococcus coagulans TaxID=74706 RepID=UPI003364E450